MPSTMTLIPKKIHLLSKEKKSFSPYLYNLQEVCPDWEINLYDDNDIDAIMNTQFPWLMEAFYMFPKHIQRLDVFRMLIVYLHGGFYLDADVKLLKSLDDLLNNMLVLGEEKTLNAYEMTQPYHKYDLRIANYMFGAIKAHPLLIKFATMALTNCNIPVRSELDVLETSGPGLFTNFIHETLNSFDGIMLVRNDTKHCPKKCTTQPSCHFGDYAVHFHNGSWRWQNA